MRKRPPIPQPLASRVLAASNHTLGRKFTGQEVAIKEQWETACAEHQEDDDEEPIDTYFRDFELGPEEYKAFTYSLGATLKARRVGDCVISVISDEDESIRVQLDVAIWEEADGNA